MLTDGGERLRERTIEVMEFSPKNVSLNSSLHSTKSEDGIVIEEISYDMPYGPRTRGFFLYPEGGTNLPAVVALHDHGGFFYYGKEKIVDFGTKTSCLSGTRSSVMGGEVGKRTRQARLCRSRRRFVHVGQ